MWLVLIEVFMGYNLFNVVAKIKDKIVNKENPIIKLIDIKILMSEKKYGQALEEAEKQY